jgi:hypothetical protein
MHDVISILLKYFNEGFIAAFIVTIKIKNKNYCL